MFQLVSSIVHDAQFLLISFVVHRCNEGAEEVFKLMMNRLTVLFQVSLRTLQLRHGSS